MKRLIVLGGVVALLAAGTAVAFANDPGPAAPVAQAADDDPDVPAPQERGSFLGDVLAELVDEGVITQDQADAIGERLAERKSELDGLGFHGHGFRHFKGPRGFEFPEGFEFRGPIEIPDEVREQLDELLEGFRGETDAPFGDRFFRFPGGSLRDFLDDGELSEGELDQLEAELRELAERFSKRFEGRFDFKADEAGYEA